MIEPKAQKHEQISVSTVETVVVETTQMKNN